MIINGIEGKPKLHRAVRHSENVAIIKELCKAGEDVNAKDKDGNTALHVAASKPYWLENSTILLIEELINAGADINAKNDDGKTPYDLCHPILKNNPKVIALLNPTK